MTIQDEVLFSIRSFPPVIHPRHAREILATGTNETLAAWVGGYSTSVPEHRQLLEDLFSSLAWGDHGQAGLIQGLYGTGKSHLLVLLHLLIVLPAAWPAFLDTHPLFRRFAPAMQQHRRLVVHFSLDEYAPRFSLEQALGHAVARTLTQAGISLPAAWDDAVSRQDAWMSLLECCHAQGYDGVVLLVDELSLFLASKRPALRESDAAFLQFLADLTLRTSIWLFGTLQRTLSDTGALRTHSWRQVEDRFRRYTLSPQEIGGMLCEKMLERRNPAAIRAAVSDQIVPTAQQCALSFSTGALQLCWPFHPMAIALVMAVVNTHLSPHRSMVGLLQCIADTEWTARPADQLITPLDFYSLIVRDLRNDERLQPVWQAVDLLAHGADDAPDREMAQRCLDLLTLVYLANQTANVDQLRLLLFDGRSTPSIADISRTLHYLRQRGAYLGVVRDADPGQEVFSLAIRDEVGAQALMRMQDMRLMLSADDPQVIDAALLACRDAAWPFCVAVAGGTLSVPWHGGHPVQIECHRYPDQEAIARRYEGLLAGHADGYLMLGWPDGCEAYSLPDTLLPDDPSVALLLQWLPRLRTDQEKTLWLEYASWQRAADACVDATAHGRQIRQRCQERAEELRVAVEADVRAIYLEGEWHDLRQQHGSLSPASSLVDVLADIFAHGFSLRYPLAAEFTAGGIPSPAICQQLHQQFLQPGAVQLSPQSLLGEYIERYLVPLGCVRLAGLHAQLSAPRREIVEQLLHGVSQAPLRVADALAVLRRAPLGLPVELGRLALAAALQSGVMRGLDAFLQPVSTDTLPGALFDSVVFVDAPALLDDSYRPQVLSLAAHWQISVESWPVVCCQLDRQLRGWLAVWRDRLPHVRTAMQEWRDLLQVPPWGWRVTEDVLARIDGIIGDSGCTLERLLDLFDAAHLAIADHIWEATCWWQAHGAGVALLLPLPLPANLACQVQDICASLSGGEASFPLLPAIGEQCDALIAAYTDEYQRWHERVFGATVITALRASFDLAEFRAVKALARLPLPVPEAVTHCLAALAQARECYCPGASPLDDGGCCPRCRLPLGSPTPMPDAAMIREWAIEGLRAYADELAIHPWMRQVQTLIARAPEALALKGEQFLTWQPTLGAEVLVTALDEGLIAWLCRDHQTAGVRHISEMQARLHGRDLTMREAQAVVRDWLDPERLLSDDTLLTFE